MTSGDPTGSEVYLICAHAGGETSFAWPSLATGRHKTGEILLNEFSGFPHLSQLG